MAKLNTNQDEQQQERRLTKLKREKVGMIDEWINQKNEWDRLQKKLKT
jgi:hypothetical protein